MNRCPTCATELPSGACACPRCGATVAAADPPPTVPHHASAHVRPAGGTLPLSEGALFGACPPLPDNSPFVPGQMLAGRYRIVALLGKGGMGEVYRADDLILGVPVAMKFLPAHLSAEADRLERFRNEVRVARQISHPNVCRVYDIGEADGRIFLTMEFVDGEDLASLLRRVGRLPEERGLELARQMCAGLAAAHEQGVLHRDLKPANVMVDGRGQARITDFGLAGQAVSFFGQEVRAGTPAYQAPEQLAGREVTARSDIYALGLILYEMFTGRAAFSGGTLDELVKLREIGPPALPSSVVRGLDPALERVILHCLDGDPARRPPSAKVVSASLPGGDPLAAALAAGETPSPRLVADAGGEGTLAPLAATTLLAVVLVGMLAFAWLNDFTVLFRKVPQELSAHDLATKSRELLRSLGHTQPPRDTASGFLTDTDALAALAERDRTAARWDGLETGRPAVLYFWYRQSPAVLAQRLSGRDILGYGMPGRVTPTEPPLTQPGMSCVFLDLKGRLIELHAVPPRTPPAESTAGAQDEAAWQALFQAAGLPKDAFRPVPPQRDPPLFCTSHAAWEGAYPERPDLPVRVEAAAWHGLPVYFHLGPPGSAERLTASEVPPDVGTAVEENVYSAIRLCVLTVGAWLAWRNFRAGRANVPSALRVAGLFAGAVLLKWVLLAKHVKSANDEWAMLAAVLGRVLLDAGTLFLAYLALEPEVRRRWPWRIIGWERLLEGRWRDPLVGRDFLVGAAVGVAGALLLQLHSLIPTWLGWGSTPWQFWEVTLTCGPGVLFEYVHYTVFFQVLDFFLLFLLLLALRRAWLAVPVWFLLRLSHDTLKFETEPLWLMALLTALRLGLVVFALLRFGLLSFVVAAFYFYLLTDLPLTTDVTAWYAGTGLWVMAALGALAGFAFVRSLGGRPVLERILHGPGLLGEG